MELTVGEVLEGKVTGIAKFGAFVALDPGAGAALYIFRRWPTPMSVT